MNLLAHATFVPYGDPLRLTAAVAGDQVRGSLESVENLSLHPSILEGVRLHRALDTLSDSHPALLSAKALFPDSNRRFAGIALDLLGDWVLWRHWREFQHEPQWDFVKKCERTLVQNRIHLPPAAADWTNRILSMHLLTACTSPQGIRIASRRVSGRLTQPDGLQSACETAILGISSIEPKLLEFFESARVFIVKS